MGRIIKLFNFFIFKRREEKNGERGYDQVAKRENRRGRKRKVRKRI